MMNYALNLEKGDDCVSSRQNGYAVFLSDLDIIYGPNQPFKTCTDIKMGYGLVVRRNLLLPQANQSNRINQGDTQNSC